jgi:hypothetical protein
MDITDTEYLLSIYPNATDNEIERFCERVAICVADHITEDVARAIALAGLE